MSTDLALRCLTETYTNLCDDAGEESPAAKRWKSNGANRPPNNAPSETCSKSLAENWSPVGGIVIALCCHHRCDWKHYVGREFFTSVGLGMAEFNYFKRMTSWATCGMRERGPQISTTETESTEQASEAEEHDLLDRSVECSSDSLHG